MVTYEYNNVVNSPNLEYIQEEVLESEMTNKTIEYCRWNEENSILLVVFTNSLSGDDKAILDTIISNCPDISEDVPTEIRLKSPNGTSWILIVGDDGVLDTEEDV
jgi:hypothetical protein